MSEKRDVLPETGRNVSDFTGLQGPRGLLGLFLLLQDSRQASVGETSREWSRRIRLKMKPEASQRRSLQAWSPRWGQTSLRTAAPDPGILLHVACHSRCDILSLTDVTTAGLSQWTLRLTKTWAYFCPHFILIFWQGHWPVFWAQTLCVWKCVKAL